MLTKFEPTAEQLELIAAGGNVIHVQNDAGLVSLNMFNNVGLGPDDDIAIHGGSGPFWLTTGQALTLAHQLIGAVVADWPKPAE